MPRAEVCAAEVRFAHATALLYLVFLVLELAAQRAALSLVIRLRSWVTTIYSPSRVRSSASFRRR